MEHLDTLVRLPLHSILREFPNKLDHVIGGRQDLRSPRELHPAFYGSFDWHSAVHGHWTLVRLLKLHPDRVDPLAREALRENLTEQNLAAEAAYLDGADRKGFERPYGWTWLLKLALELRDWHDDDGDRWRRWLQPLEERIAERYIEFLPKQTYPVRVGTHGSTAFGLIFALEYAKASGNRRLESALGEAAIRYFAGDGRLPVEWEPSGADFLSPALVEADLMGLVLEGVEWRSWLDRCIGGELPSNLGVPATVTDRTDGQLSHLDGLNLSRAWNLRRIARRLPAGHGLKTAMQAAADVNLQAGLAGLQGGTYEGDHWLASFAMLALTDA